MKLEAQDKLRYARHFSLPEFGESAQLKLIESKVLVVGAGGLGCPVLSYLAAAGVGTIGIVDDDLVSLSNLQRQVLYSESDLELRKVEVAAEKLRELNSSIQVVEHSVRFAAENARELVAQYQLVLDCSDNFTTRYLINDACVLEGKPFVFAAINRFEGQLAVFNLNSKAPTYRCIFPKAPPADAIPNCAEAGVLGVLPGVVGALQANEAIKVLADLGDVLSGKMLCFDALRAKFQVIELKRNEKYATVNEIIVEGDSCMSLFKSYREISPSELHTMIPTEQVQLVDVREPFEHAVCNLGGDFIPLGQLESNLDRISRDKKVIFICHHGVRSKRAIDLIEQQLGLTNLYNLTGGIDAWARDVDPEMPKY
ncbi:MAG: molybdopterin-synthase adenylyltransferase MoeB [Deltaproteobacteria bacterium]|nr:molybdopterin-synthase adenylyltransferase MoeB [Deltaproteobacteria bacterium]